MQRLVVLIWFGRWKTRSRGEFLVDGDSSSGAEEGTCFVSGSSAYGGWLNKLLSSMKKLSFVSLS
jgi:hypothetical protein